MTDIQKVLVAAAMMSQALLVFFPSVVAAEFKPAIQAGITYTDNVFLDSVDEQDDLIFRIEPSIGYLHESRRLTVAADYLLQSLWYKDFGENAIHHQYDASVELAVIPDALFLEVGADRSQSIADPRLPIPRSNLPISSNRVDRDEYYVMPRLQTRLGDSVGVAALYRQAWVDYDRRSIQGIDNKDAVFSMDNFQRGRGLTWALNYDWRNSEYDSGTEWENQRATAQLGAWLTEKFRIFASGGRESPWDDRFNSSLEDTIWEAGFAYESADRLSAEFAAGERSFGNSWRGSLTFRFRRGSTTFRYSESPNTEGRIRYGGGFPGLDIPVTNDLSFPGRNDLFISNRLDWNLTLGYRRTTFAVNIYNDERTDRTDALGVPLSDQSLIGGNVSANYELGARTSLRIGGSFAEREFEVDEVRDAERYFVTVNYEMSPRLSLSLEYRFTESQRTSGLTPGREYDANTVSLLLSWARSGERQATVN